MLLLNEAESAAAALTKLLRLLLLLLLFLLLLLLLQVWPGEVVYPSYLGDKAAPWLKSQMQVMYDQVSFGEYGYFWH
jgi:hypothetical protein